MFFDSTHLDEHFERAESRLLALPGRAAFGFALACVERQLPCFERAAAGRAWEHKVPEIRAALDGAWLRLTTNAHLSSSLLDGLAENVPEASDAPSVVANNVTNYVVDLLSAILAGDTAYPCQLPSANIGLLEVLADEHDLNGLDLDSVRQLAQVEMEREQSDLQALADDPSEQGLERVRKDSIGKSLFGGVWFPE